MTPNIIRLLFLGNWGLGHALLRALHEHPAVEVVAAITRTQSPVDDPYAGAVHEYTQQQRIKTLDQDNLATDGLAKIIRQLDVDLLFVHAYMHLLPESIFNAPRLGAVNVHASLLPKHRGPDPLSAVLQAGETTTGLTAHFIDHGIDSGDIIHQIAFDLTPGEQRNDILDRYQGFAAALVDNTICKLLDPTFVPTAQDNSKATYAPKGGRTS